MVASRASKVVVLALGVNTMMAQLFYTSAFQQAIFQQGIAAVSLFVEDIQAEFARMTGRGVRFTMEPTSMGPTTVAVLDDTCGNLIQLVQVRGSERLKPRLRGLLSRWQGAIHDKR